MFPFQSSGSRYWGESVEALMQQRRQIEWRLNQARFHHSRCRPCCCCCCCRKPEEPEEPEEPVDLVAYGGKWLLYNGTPIVLGEAGVNVTVPLPLSLPHHNVAEGGDSLIIKVGGNYEVTWAFNVVPNENSRLDAAVAVNGAVQPQSEMIITAAQQFVEQKMGSTTFLTLEAGDVVTLVVKSDVPVELFPYTTATATLLVRRLGGD